MVDLDWTAVRPALPFLARGMATTLEMTAVAMAAGLACGTALAVLRLSPARPLRWLAAAYVNTFRAVPLVMVLLWFFLLVPSVLERALSIPRSADTRLASAMVAFALFEAAYYAEIIRAGIGSVPGGQLAAALALGMTRWQALRHVVLPQAFRAMIPLLLTQGVILFQDTSLVYVSALADFFGAAYKVGDRDGRLVELLLFAGAVYLAVCYPLSLAVRRYQRRLAT